MKGHGYGRSMQGEQRRLSAGEKRLEKWLRECRRANEKLDEKKKQGEGNDYND
ncbi:MAG TPA: hypothetical protein PLL21_04550 [Sedimentibacter sp.]|nr:hypothetical protein [Sedimentibacter sp.]